MRNISLDKKVDGCGEFLSKIATGEIDMRAQEVCDKLLQIIKSENNKS